MSHSIDLDYLFTKNWVTRSKPHVGTTRESRGVVRFVDLFCGCGGLTAGFIEACKFSDLKPIISLAIDSNPDAIGVYRKNFECFSENIVQGDITRLFEFRENVDLNNSEKEIKEHLAPIDFLVAGPPCQGHSDLNNSTRRNDPRNALYLSCIQAIKVLEPEFVIIENVPTVIYSKENVVNKTKAILSTLGYEYKEMKIDFLRLGLPQSRKRHLLLASKKPGVLEHIEQEQTTIPTPKLEDFIKDLEDETADSNPLNSSGKLSDTNRKRVNYLFKHNLHDLPDNQRPNCHKNGNHSYKSSYGRLRYDQPAQTITSGFGSVGQGRYVHPTRERTITIREAARIQGFPDDHNFSSVRSTSALRKMIANAVPPQLCFTIMQTVFELSNMKHPPTSAHLTTRNAY